MLFVVGISETMADGGKVRQLLRGVPMFFPLLIGHSTANHFGFLPRLFRPPFFNIAGFHGQLYDASEEESFGGSQLGAPTST